MNRDTLRRAAPWIVTGATALAFLGALQGEFLNWDDDKNFLDNPHYRGLGLPHLKWMATTFHMGHWHPVTWLTLGLDYTIWGMNPFGYHLTSLLLHTASALLLYGVLRAFLRLGDRPDLHWPAAVGALLYAVHPLRVESVAWITERRDVTCGVFTLLTLLFYLRRVEDERAGRDATRWLALSVAAFAAALLSKALCIMLPAVLLLIDAYPLRRFTPESRGRVLREKIPFLILMILDAGVMLVAMRSIDAVHSPVGFNLPVRVAQASYGLCFYLLKTVWPAGLAPLYRIDPHLQPLAPPYLGAMLAVAAITALLFLRRKQAPGLLATWLAYVLLLLPVLGLAVTGRQIAADRYTYLALIPVTILAALALGRLDARRNAVIAASAAVVLLLGALTWRQAGFWKDSRTLWEREIAIDPDCAVAYENRGAARAAAGDPDGALEDYDAAIRLDGGEPAPWYNRGGIKATRGDLEGAIADFSRALALRPDHANALSSRAVARADRRDAAGAMADLDAALRLEPGSTQTIFNRGLVRFKLGDLAGAVDDFTRCLELQPDFALAYSNRAQAELRRGRMAEARRDLDRTLDLRPDHALSWADRGLLRSRAGDLDGALSDLGRALRLKPEPTYYLRRATVSGMKGDLEAAVLDLDAALRLKPDYAEAYAGRGMARLEQGRNPDAEKDLQKALELLPAGSPQRVPLSAALQRAKGLK
jgi:tetratricopeptide (TPR) repeat protein